MKRFIKSIGYALKGWLFFFGKEKNGQLQMAAAFIVILFGFFFISMQLSGNRYCYV
jgi:diacylglycerol kinase